MRQPSSGGVLHWRRARKQLKACAALLRSHPSILLTAAAIFLLLVAAGLATVILASAAEVTRGKEAVYNGVANEAVMAMREAWHVTAFGSEMLALYVTQTPTCPEIDAQWESVAETIYSKIDRRVVVQLELDVMAVIWKVAPPLPEELAKVLMGRDLLKRPEDRPGVIQRLLDRRMAIMGPYICAGGFPCMFTVTPIFLPVSSYEYDWGCGFESYNCTDLCWDPLNKTKFWGQVSTMVNVESLMTGDNVRLRSLALRGFRYKLWQEATTPDNPYFQLAQSDPPPTDPMRRCVQAYNLVWCLELSPGSGWVPSWRSPCIVVVVVGSAVVAGLVLWLLISREQHNELLRAMLPSKVIRQLQVGESTVAQEYGNVTILFSDIVGYTQTASRLSAWEVVTLLNELFTVFDGLVARNGVYKVETIGDCIMCVAGCPNPDDPARNAVRMAHMALDMVAAVRQFTSSLPGVRVEIRVGLHSGPVVAGVVGKKMPRYCLFGDTVNTSSRMESTSQPMRIQLSWATAALLADSGESFLLTPRGSVPVKGKGSMHTFWLHGGPNHPAPPDTTDAASPATAMAAAAAADSSAAVALPASASAAGPNTHSRRVHSSSADGGFGVSRPHSIISERLYSLFWLGRARFGNISGSGASFAGSGGAAAAVAAAAAAVAADPESGANDGGGGGSCKGAVLEVALSPRAHAVAASAAGAAAQLGRGAAAAAAMGSAPVSASAAPDVGVSTLSTSAATLRTSAPVPCHAPDFPTYHSNSVGYFAGYGANGAAAASHNSGATINGGSSSCSPFARTTQLPGASQPTGSMSRLGVMCLRGSNPCSGGGGGNRSVRGGVAGGGSVRPSSVLCVGAAGGVSPAGGCNNGGAAGSGRWLRRSATATDELVLSVDEGGSTGVTRPLERPPPTALAAPPVLGVMPGVIGSGPLVQLAPSSKLDREHGPAVGAPMPASAPAGNRE